MDIRHLKQFLAVAETCSFTQGAKQAHVSQPAISSTIAKLEAELDCRLFLRNKRVVVLTAEGERLQRSARKMLDEYARLKSDFSSKTSIIPVTVYVSTTFPVKQVARVLSALSHHLPRLSFKLTDASPDQVLDALKNHRCDLAFCILHAQETTPPRCDSIALGTERYGVAVQRDHPLAQFASVDLEDIVHDPFIGWTEYEYCHAVVTKLKAKKLHLNVVHQTDQDSRALSLVAAGMGITVTPMMTSHDDIHVIPFNDTSLQRVLSVQLQRDMDPTLLTELTAVFDTVIASAWRA